MLGLFLNFVVMLGLAKSLSSSFRPYKAAIAYAFFTLVLSLFFQVTDSMAGLAVTALIKGAVAFAIFWLLDRFEDTLFIWLLVFGLGFVILTIV